MKNKQEKPAKYFVTFAANGGSTYSREPIPFSSKAEALKTARAIVSGNHFRKSANSSTFEVTDANDRVIYCGCLCGDTDRFTWITLNGLFVR